MRTAHVYVCWSGRSADGSAHARHDLLRAVPWGPTGRPRTWTTGWGAQPVNSRDSALHLTGPLPVPRAPRWQRGWGTGERSPAPTVCDHRAPPAHGPRPVASERTQSAGPAATLAGRDFRAAAAGAWRDCPLRLKAAPARGRRETSAPHTAHFRPWTRGVFLPSGFLP